MSIKADTPQVAALRMEIERITGSISSHSSFGKLSTLIEERLREHISITTLERVWGYSTRNNLNISVRILNILSQLTGADDWKTFCTRLEEKELHESEFFTNENTINSGRLAAGTRIRIGWLPNRICEIEYLGENRFVAVRTENSSIKEGDCFCCFQIQKGRELYMDCFTRKDANGDENGRYVVGQASGLTLVEIIEE